MKYLILQPRTQKRTFVHGHTVEPMFKIDRRKTLFKSSENGKKNCLNIYYPVNHVKFLDYLMRAQQKKNELLSSVERRQVVVLIYHDQGNGTHTQGMPSDNDGLIIPI